MCTKMNFTQGENGDYKPSSLGSIGVFLCSPAGKQMKTSPLGDL